MFDEQIDNEQELQEIIEEAFEEEDSVSDEGGLGGLNSLNPKHNRAQEKDEIRNLRTELMTIREKLADKTAKIDQIKDTLKQSVGVTDFERVLEQVHLEEERDDILSSEGDEDYYTEEQPDF